MPGSAVIRPAPDRHRVAAAASAGGGGLVDAVSVDWYSGLLPTGLTLDWFRRVLGDPVFQRALGRSLFLAIGSVVLNVIVTLPAILAAHCYLPSLDRWMERLVILPYALPQVVIVVGLLALYADGPVRADRHALDPAARISPARLPAALFAAQE